MPALFARWTSPALKRWLWATLAITCALATNACSTNQPAAQLAGALMDAPSAVHVPQLPPRLTYQLEVAPQTSLWPLLRAGFQLDHRVDEKRVQQEIAWLKRHPDYLIRIGKRAERYLAYMHQEISSRGLPSELALLPIVESALDPYAFSPGGAAGLWQFIPATAKRFGVTMNWWFEGRRDPVQATDGALNYLQVLHNRFDDWPHALASYNTGEGRVARSIRRARKADKPTDFFNLKLPRETSAYVPRLLAYAAVVANPERYGIELPDVDRDPGFQVVELEGQYDIAVIAREIDVDPETLYRWNPALNQWATPPGGPHRLLIPTEFAEHPGDIAAQLANVPNKQRVQFARYVVKPGDALSTIARSNSTDTATLVRVNHLRSNRINIGQALLIPKASMSADAYPTPLNQRQGDSYTVASGDSLWTISRRFNVGMTALMKLNEVGPKSTLRVGQEMLIPASAKSSAGNRTVALPPETKRTLRYSVRRGDSLHRIAGKFGVTVAQISSWNSLDAGRLLQPGQMLKLTVNAASAR